jgi:hypothetical protein
MAFLLIGLINVRIGTEPAGRQTGRWAISGHAEVTLMKLICDSRLAQMPQGQWRSRLHGLDGNVASNLADDRQVEELADEEALVMLQVGHDHLQQVVGLARDQMAGDHLGHGLDRFFEFEGGFVGMAVDLHAHEDREAEAN